MIHRCRNVGVSYATGRILSRHRKGTAKRPIWRRTRQTDTCQVPGTSAISSDGVASTLWKVGGWEGELAGYAKVLLRARDAHGIRVPSIRPGERQRSCLSAQRSGHRMKCGSQLWSRDQVAPLEPWFCKAWSQRKNANTRLQDFGMAGGDGSRFICLL